MATEGVEYGVIRQAEAAPMASLLSVAFSRFEPMAVAIGISRDQMEALVMAWTPKALDERLTVVAREAGTGELLGALLADDFGTPPPTGLHDALPDFAPVGALLEGLEAQYRANATVSPGTHAHLFMVGVAEHASSRGIATGLVATCIENARRRGYRTALTEATSSASQRVFRRLGFRDLHVTSYGEFSFASQRVFSSIEGVEGAVLMTRDLVDELSSPRNSL